MLTLETSLFGECLMKTLFRRLHAGFGELHAASAPLTVVGALMTAALAMALVGMWVDPRLILGAPAWLKPAKFAASTAIYAFTLAWIMRYLSDWPRVRKTVGWTTAAVFVLEVALISLQAWRGTTSHFNVGTVFDGLVFGVMGGAIVVQTVASGAVAVALWRQRFADAALGWALRLAMVLTIAGASTGGLMTRPTDTQLAAARAGERMVVAGAHTVGAPDGGPGLPGTGWSVDHGDLRVPHFVGLHALQALPLFALWLRRRRLPDRVRVRLTGVAAASYAALFGILVWQALRGQSLMSADAAMLTVVAAWALLTGAGAAVAARRRVPPRVHAYV
jgi:hypothetical protein